MVQPGTEGLENQIKALTNTGNVKTLEERKYWRLSTHQPVHNKNNPGERKKKTTATRYSP
jgi:hypothetical protein